MEIADIETHVLRAELERPFGWSQGWHGHREVLVVKVTTDEGIVGWGETSGPEAGPLIRQMLAPLLVGQDPTNREDLWQRMYAGLVNRNTAIGFAMTAISALDIALWDITGKATGLPVYQLMGGMVRPKVAVYATGLYYMENDFPHDLVAEATGYVEQGYKGMKMKVGGLSVAEDLERVAAIREAIGPDVHLMVDANQAYNAFTAIRLGEQLCEHDILWFEEPVPAHDLNAYLEVKAALPMAIAGGENLHTRYAFREFLARRAYDIVQPDVVHVGGLTEVAKVAAMANAFGVQVNPHVWGSPIMTAATLHLCAALPPCPPARNSQPYAQEPVMEFDQTPNPIRETLCVEPFEQRDGFVQVPTGPGLGIEVDEQAIERLAEPAWSS